MAFIKNPMAKVVGNSNPGKIDLVCEVKVQFSELDRAILQNAANQSAFAVTFTVRNYDPVPDRLLIPLEQYLGDLGVSLSMGAPDAHLFLTKTFNRGAQLNEDPFPFPGDEDEIFVEMTLYNLFSGTKLGKVNTSVVKGRF